MFLPFNFVDFDFDGDEMIFDRCILNQSMCGHPAGTHVDVISVNVRSGGAKLERWARESSHDPEKSTHLGDAVLNCEVKVGIPNIKERRKVERRSEYA